MRISRTSATCRSLEGHGRSSVVRMTLQESRSNGYPCCAEMSLRRALRGIAAVGGGPVSGAEWSFEPSVGLRTEYNDNIPLTPEPHPSVWGMILSPDVKFSGATETLTVTGGLNLSFNRYLDQPQLNIDNYDLSLRSSLQGRTGCPGIEHRRHPRLDLGERAGHDRCGPRVQPAKPVDRESLLEPSAH